MVSKPTAITTNDKGEATQMASSAQTPFAQTNTDYVSAAATSNNSTDEELRRALLSALANSPSSHAFVIVDANMVGVEPGAVLASMPSAEDAAKKSTNALSPTSRSSPTQMQIWSTSSLQISEPPTQKITTS
ncbi:hypothetical protein M409DRAFT_57335 [Zasmidium cellare ATCC 36951]|uniref:Uncharacterized protein n=1 Tax=Zasmidium cellare ATCC 36951 TaxID=1080233 RepID=A0A6A6C8B4_ZASCE|nr:uncharacterized protein M409DRAFT_57335 [Zasmidium cellare ATCC 36951]KAF2163427.1 hypothetical protein M409DRAFT_57335 [Zasmidium cellare ATCC 36951]